MGKYGIYVKSFLFRTPVCTPRNNCIYKKCSYLVYKNVQAIQRIKGVFSVIKSFFSSSYYFCSRNSYLTTDQTDNFKCFAYGFSCAKAGRFTTDPANRIFCNRVSILKRLSYRKLEGQAIRCIFLTLSFPLSAEYDLSYQNVLYLNIFIL